MMTFTAKIIGQADSQHYLVGALDLNNGFVKLPQLGEVIRCQSLHEAKAILRECNIEYAQLTLQSAYDEMCGMPPSAPTTQTIYL